MSDKNNSGNLNDDFNTQEKLTTTIPISRSSDENNKNQNSTPKYQIFDENKNEIGDVNDKLTKLHEYKVKETEIIRKLNQINMKNVQLIHYQPFSDSYITADFFADELYGQSCITRSSFIIDNPHFFESSSISRFIKRKRISVSNSSVVFICVNKFTGKSFVVKSGFKPRSEHRYLTDSSRAIMNEVKILTFIGRHVHIVDYYDSWIEDESYRIQLEFVRGGSLRDFIMGNKLATVCDMSDSSKMQRISDCSAFILLAQMSSVLAYLHDYLHVFHGNIEPANILVDLCEYQTEDTKGECHKALLQSYPNRLLRFKLCDFSQSGVRNSRIRDHLLYSRDIQSLGLTIYQCFGGEINSNILIEIKNGNMIMMPDNLSDEWRAIIQNMSEVNEINRFKAREIIELKKVKAFVLPESSCFLRYEAEIRASTKLYMPWTEDYHL